MFFTKQNERLYDIERRVKQLECKHKITHLDAHLTCLSEVCDICGKVVKRVYGPKKCLAFEIERAEKNILNEQKNIQKLKAKFARMQEDK